MYDDRTQIPWKHVLKPQNAIIMNHVLYLENYLYSKDFIFSEKMSTVTEEDVELRDLVSTVLGSYIRW